MATGAIEKWTLLHERVANLGATGLASAEIAKVVNRPQEWVEHVLDSDQAQGVKEKWFIDLKLRLFAKFEGEFAELMELSLRNLRRTLIFDVDPEVDFNAKKHQDRVSLEVMKMARVAQESNRDLGKGLSLTTAESQLLVDAIAKAKEAESYADYEIVEAEKNGK